jgi:large subunit ribosomal protein L29
MVEKAAKIRGLSSAELYSKLEDAQQELMNLNFQQSTGELTDFSRIKKTRRYIARLLTILRERDLMVDVGGEK